jgi:hypothetical protein
VGLRHPGKPALLGAVRFWQRAAASFRLTTRVWVATALPGTRTRRSAGSHRAIRTGGAQERKQTVSWVPSRTVPRGWQRPRAPHLLPTCCATPEVELLAE